MKLNLKSKQSMFPRKLRKYWHVWWTSSKLSAQVALASRGGAYLFILGKFLRFGLFIYFLFILSGNIQMVAGYDYQTLLTFFLVFNLFDLFGQLFFRGIYWFRNQIISGEFDFRLVKPMNPLFQALTRQTDILDIPLLIVVIIGLMRQGIAASPAELALFAAMGLVGMLLITAFHVCVAALGVITTEVDHTIMIYRDLSLMARFPVDIYASQIRVILTYILPIAVIFTFPAKALLGLLTPTSIIVGLVITVIFVLLSYQFWRYALTQYSSASS